MTRRLNYRKAVLSAVDAFLQGDPEHVATGKALLKTCERTLIPWSVNSLLWGELLGTLSDSIYYRDPSYLRTIRTSLRHGDSVWHRIYVLHDFQKELSANEDRWHQALIALYDYVRQFPFGNESAITDYTSQRAAVLEWQATSPSPTQIGDEMLHHLMMHEVSSTLCAINAWASSIRYGYLVADTPYVALTDDDAPPNVSHFVLSTGYTLQALTGNRQAYIHWRREHGDSMVIVLQT